MLKAQYNSKSALTSTSRSLLIGVCLFTSPLLSSEGKTKSELFEFKSLTFLTDELNQIAQKSDVPFQIRLKNDREKPKGPVAIILLSPKSQVGNDPLSDLSNNSSNKSKGELDRFDKTPVIGELEGKSKTDGEGALRFSLPLPTARVLSPVQSTWSSKDVTDAPPRLKPTDEKDSISLFTPKATRFGADRYDSNLFGLQPPSTTKSERNAFQAAPEPIQSKSSMPMMPLSTDLKLGAVGVGGASKLPPQEENQKDPKKEALEKLQKGIKEFAERDEEKDAFTLADYYDVRGLLSTHSGLLAKMESEELDERFIKNARSIYERFGDKDNSPDKKSFEQFLKRLEPPAQVLQGSGNLPSAKSRNSSRHSN